MSNPKEVVKTHHSIANATDDSPNTDQRVSVSSSLQYSADDHDETTPKGRRLAAPFLSVEQDDHSTEETSNLVDGNSESLGVCISSALARIGLVAVTVDPTKFVGSLSRCHERKDSLPAL